jgi:NAD(P)-dependent dehydrogenase (short-subunit alcohol dehydrogenase family)
MSSWLITGCSTGLGRALAEAVISAGHNAVVAAVRRSDERFGAVDVLVNNAGCGYRAAVEDAEVRELFETHFFGGVALIKAVLPGMRARRGGAIVNISSIGATVTPVGSGYYAAA